MYIILESGILHHINVINDADIRVIVIIIKLHMQLIIMFGNGSFLFAIMCLKII